MNHLLEKQIREAVLQGLGAEIAPLVLTPTQVALHQFVKGKGLVGTGEVSRYLGCSVQNAHGKLNKLYQRGYLKRKVVVAPSGGHEYMYFVEAGPIHD